RPERCAATRRWPAGRLLSVGPRSHAVAQQARPGGLDLGGVTLDLRSPTRKLSPFMVILAMPKSGGLIVAISRTFMLPAGELLGAGPIRHSVSFTPLAHDLPWPPCPVSRCSCPRP